ncbi:MAG: aspartate aminotransferase family protein [Candidatus Competibacterales bacterium]|nr:aspartate aminotransferase family protein [Candidatus Competibacterales bacterium]
MPATTDTLSDALVATGRARYVPNYKPREMILDHGRGARLWDLDGNDYYDLGAGIAVSALGHQDPELLAALEAQARRLWHTSNIYFTEPAVRLADELAGHSFAERVFFCNSGAEANEAAIKLARRYASQHHPPEKRDIVTFCGGFHGRTLATVTATAQPKYHAGFEPLPGGFRYCAFNDFGAAAAMIGENTCAVLVEPIQGEGGIVPARPGFLLHLRELCDRTSALLILDEIQSGMGRSGRLFAHQWEEGLTPDVMTLAKGLGGGMPIGALLVGRKAAETLDLGSHGSTFGGNPLACAAARVVLRRVADNRLLGHVQYQGERLRQWLETLNGELELFREIRGRGLMLGAELSEARAGQAGELMEQCRQHGVLVLQAGADVLRLVPPLTITPRELDAALERLDAALRRFAAG